MTAHGSHPKENAAQLPLPLPTHELRVLESIIRLHWHANEYLRRDYGGPELAMLAHDVACVTEQLLSLDRKSVV